MTMDQKLKALKVVDLKSILVAASVAIPTKVTKPELIARILASQPALDAYHRQYEPSDDLLAPPEDVDWNVDQPDLLAVDPQPVIPADPPKPPPPAPPSTIPVPSPPKVVDSELEKRKQRAARFGIPLVENAAKSTGKLTAAPLPQAALPDDPAKLSTRAARFGVANPVAPTPTVPYKTQKRAAATELIDPEELERRKRRAERFAVSTTD
ncbi:uncharacterized protein LACBIDRAFT_313572 [Laccaria bicolor S238N-H82]|uniref:Predicted protein n=1 Tax=Laccaria bicolor (strain S238N-H82 / ATCC MYA-4686) TaxID=486041 RepID=B0D0A7_LACBS|nr:uncharacterized protein LACBIDRAFT_313572 [Laccaria bicolor S238N-H82]EDR11798.1 predicted protein [Laccaria bicolor S238N-H82]|eukprot:XP_001877695.1 predicted protein [Laccaria bicolor S238N-H82]